MRSLVVFAIAIVVASTPASAQGQESDNGYAERGPRFLVALSPTPVRADIAKTPMLRRRLSLDLQSVPLTEALRMVSEKSGVHLAFSNAMIPNRTVRFRADNITIAAALTELLLDARVDILFSADGRGVLVRRQANAVPAGKIAGRVTDVQSGESLSGVEVFLAGTRWRTLTDTAGQYVLADVEVGRYEFVVRRLGYVKQTRNVAVEADQETAIDLALEPRPVALSELVATATGQQRRRDLGNAITTIHADSLLRNAPVQNLTDLLQGRVPGLTVQHTSGAPGDPARLRLRGLGSVLRSNDPIVIVDGVRVYAAQSQARSGNLTNVFRNPNADAFVAAPSPLDQIDPNIIEKVEVFKGPSAATLYGADAANGVIVITTKKGRPGPTQWQASVTRGRTTPAGRFPDGYYRWGRRWGGGGTPILCTITDSICEPEPDSLVRYQALNDPDATVLGQGHSTSLSLTASGGTQALTYSITGTYGNDVGLLTLPAFEQDRFRAAFNRDAPDWMTRPHHLTTWSVASNVQARLASTADVTLATTVSRTEQQRSTLENQLASLARTYVDKVNGQYYTGYGFPTTTGFLTNYFQRTTASSIRFTTGLNASWRPTAWIDVSSQAGLDVMPRNDEQFRPAGLVQPTDSGELSRGTGRSLVSTFNLQGTLRRRLRWGFTFETSAGANLMNERTDDLASRATRLVPGTSSLNGAGTITALERHANTSVFGWYIEPRIRGERFSLSTGLRLDGGSAYGARVTNLLGLPKLNASWVISEEPFFPLKSFFSSLRLRGAYGQAQVQPGPADRFRLYRYAAVTGQPDPVVELTSFGNTKLRPERSTEFEGGFDADLFDSRLSLELTAYRKTQVDALMAVTLPGSVGGGTVLTNIGTVRNTGLELTLGMTPVQLPAFTWSTQLVYNRNDNKLVDLGEGVDTNPLEGLVAGYPVGARWARPIVGFADPDGDGLLMSPDRRRDNLGDIRVGESYVYMGRLLPAYTMTLHTNVVLFGGAVGAAASFSYESGATQIDEAARTNKMLSRAFVDPTAPLSEQAALLADTDYGVTQEISTFRFSTVSLRYNVAPSLARLVRAQQLSIALQGSNLGLHSTYRGKDPNVSAWSPGEGIKDTGQLPLPRLWQLRVDLRY